jgi:CMP-N,N'-diacetyllegionaminic acid synthase
VINSERVIAIIPARSRSKSIKDKNIKHIAGKPLIAWSILTGFSSKYIDRVIVSTDGEEISKISTSFGAEIIKRPSELASDTSLLIDALRDIILKLRKDGETAKYMIVLEPTSPLRNNQDIDNAIELIMSKGYDSVATFSEAELNPHRAWKIDNGEIKTFIDGAVPWLPRQKLPEAWQLNGAVYIFEIDKLPKNGVSILFGYKGSIKMPIERSLDIDNITQFLIAESALERTLND